MMPGLLERYGMELLEGLVVTLELTAISLLIGGLIAVPLTAARLSRNRVAGPLAFAYVYFFRGTPLLAQIFLVYYGAGQFVNEFKAAGLWWFFRDAWYCALFTFALNTAAYQTEIYRGAISSVPKGQWEAARALAMPRFPLFLRVILPQAAIVALRPLGNEVILMVKGSAVASIVTVLDLMGETKLAFSRSYDLTIYLYAAVLYLIVVEAIRRLWNRLDAHLTRHLVRERRPARPAELVPATH